MSGSSDHQDQDQSLPDPAGEALAGEPEPAAAAARPQRSRRARWLVRIAWSVLVLGLVVVLSMWMATRSWFIIWQVRPELEKKLGGEVTIGRAEYEGGGRITFRDVTLRARGLQGPAAEIARIGRCMVNVQMGKLLRGELLLEDMELADATVRLSESARQAGLMNFQSLAPVHEDSGGPPPPPPPRVRIRNLALEVGVHDGPAFVANGRRRMAGEMEPIADQEGWFVFDLREVDDRGRGLGAEGLLIKGEWNARTLESRSRIEGIALDERVYSMLPQQARWAWNQMQLEGRVNDVRIDWQPDAPLIVQFSVKDVAMTMPVDLGDVWTLYRNGAVEETSGRPRMNVHSGEIRVGTDSLALEDLTGEVLHVPAQVDAAAAAAAPGAASAGVVGVPYQISLTVPALPKITWEDPEHWMEEALKTAPFQASLTMENFSLRTDAMETQAVGLPTIVARTLAKFQTTGWELSTNVSVSRGEPVPDGSGNGGFKSAPLVMTGQAYINKATGKYHKFPYLLENVRAYLHFDTQRVVVEYLNGNGSNGSSFQINGVIEPPDKDASFQMNVTGLSVPLDDRLRAALNPNELRALDGLFSTASAESMARAGLLPDQAAIDRQLSERTAALEALSQLKRGPGAEAGAVADLERRIAQLDRSIAAGPFTLGGTADLRLSVTRDEGPQQPTAVGGTITLNAGGLIFEHFPYPLRVTGGQLNWSHDRVDIAPGASGLGLTFVTPEGGIGSVTGMVDFPKADGQRKIKPDLAFAVESDPANQAAYAAIPFAKGERAGHPELERDWPGLAKSKAGRMVQGLGLAGSFRYHGRIGTRDDGKMTWDFTVSLDGGTASPNALLSGEINARAPPWPADFTIRNLLGSVRVRRESVNWEDISGISDQTAVSTSGLIDISGQGGADSVTVRLENAPAHRSALNMISAGAAPRAEELWDHYQPQGRFDATVAYRSDAPPARTATLTIEPHEVSILADGQRLGLVGRGGQVLIDRDQVAFDKLALAVGEPGPGQGQGQQGQAGAAGAAGTLGLSGRWTFSGEKPSFDIGGEWLGGRFESPLVPEMLTIFGQDAQAQRYRAREPAGLFDLAYRIARAEPEAPPEFHFDLQPRTVDFSLRDTRVALQLEGGSVSITPGLITLEGLRGTTAAGSARFSVDGGVVTSGPLEATLAIDYAGALRRRQVAAFLPEVVTDALRALEFRDNDASRLDGGRLRLRESESGWLADFSGRIQVSGGEFVAGLQFSEVDGWVELDIAHVPGRPLQLSGVARASRAVVLGQALTDVEAPMELNDAADALLVSAAQARCGEGAVSAVVSAGVGARRDYQARFDLVGVPLSNLLSPATGAAGPSPPALLLAGGGGAAASIGPHAPPPPAARPAATGDVYASLSLSGLRGDAASKRGRGVFRVLNGRLTSIPLLLQIMQVMQLTLPISGGLDYADADGYVLGDTAHFERILIESTVGTAAALQLIGEGTLDLQSMEIAARFRPRSGVAILRDIIGGIGDMFYEIEVNGPLREPQARIVPLP